MTFARISALCQLINRFQIARHDESDRVVVIISFDLLNDLREKCVKSMKENTDGDEFFCGCQIIMSRDNDFLAVAYLDELEDEYHDMIEITEEDA